MTEALAVGIDLGTSGARAVAMRSDFAVEAQASARLADLGSDMRDPDLWWQAVSRALAALLDKVEPARVRSIAVDGTSGTVLSINAAGRPAAAPLMYNDPVPDDALVRKIAPGIPAGSAAHGPTSGLAKALFLQSAKGVARLLHQADWIAGRLCGRFGVTDENNALKTGYDPVAGQWPDWMGATGLEMGLLPEVVPAGTPIGKVSGETVARFGLAEDAIVVAGTTDGCASFLATGAEGIGDGVTALGSTLTVKLLSDRPVFSSRYGVYSHRILGMWLAGGASNSGGKVLSAFFSPERIESLSGRIDPSFATGLDLYPLPAPGERFPLFDPSLPPKLGPRPADDVLFLQAMLEGIAGIEASGYERLQELGAPRLRSLRSVGGGAGNSAWTAIRRNRLKVPFETSLSDEAAAGTARLALHGLRQVKA